MKYIVYKCYTNYAPKVYYNNNINTTISPCIILFYQYNRIRFNNLIDILDSLDFKRRE